jgi:hypothetical protein
MYSATPHEIRAIRNLENQINPYVLAEFNNQFHLADEESNYKSWE